ncbi:MAG: hypothetical protein K0S25_35 [Bacillus sp. (in: firmicutes)]|nr:hypothetical protein [Bacillus sp. (in: firmicutes)]
MKQASKSTSEIISNMKKPYRRVSMPSHVKRKLDELEFKVDMYSVSKVIPVRIEGVIINYKIYSAFIKKLKGFNTNLTVTSEGIALSYWKEGIRNQGKGVLQLYNISEYFEGFEHIPEAKRVDPYEQEA